MLRPSWRMVCMPSSSCFTSAGKFNGRINWLYQQWGEGIQPDTEGIERTQTDAVGRKMLRDGQLIIQRGGKTYTIQGQILQSEY